MQRWNYLRHARSGQEQQQEQKPEGKREERTSPQARGPKRWMPLFLRKWPKCFIWKCLGAIPERSSTSSTALSRRLTLMPLPASMSSLMTSTLVHATLKDWTRAFDVAWIYALLHSVIAYSLHPVQVSAGRQGFKVSSHRSTGPCWITTGERDRGRDTQGQRSLARGFYDGDGILLAILGACIG
jgi:hypothetical protein